nr:hypothetical protein B0A51_03271 [Rachicladosporium sp. CCFEE 5018]
MSEPRHSDRLGQLESGTPHETSPLEGDVEAGRSKASPEVCTDQGTQKRLQPTRAHFLADQASKPDSASQISALYLAAQELDRCRHEFNSCQDQVKLLLARERNSWARHERYHNIYLDSRRLHEASVSYKRIESVIPEQQSQVWRKRFDHDSLRLEAQHAEASDLQHERYELEVHLDNLRLNLDAAVAAIVKLTLDFARTTSLDATSSSVDPAATLDTVDLFDRRDLRLKLYYDRANDVKIVHDRLAEHEQQQYHDFAARRLRIDRGELLSIAQDEDFDELYHREKRFLEDELAIAIKDANSLWDICDHAGLNPASQAQANGSPNTASADSMSERGLRTEELAGLPFPSDFPDSTHFFDPDDVKHGISRVVEPLDFLSRGSRPLAAEHRARSNVERWVRDIEDGIPVEFLADEPWLATVSLRSHSRARSVPTISRAQTPATGVSSNVSHSTAPDLFISLPLQQRPITDAQGKLEQINPP